MTILSGTQLAKYYGAELIFDHVTFQVARGEKIALVGPNGVGKSTLMKMIVGHESPSDGSIHRSKGLRIAYQAQEARFPEGSSLLQEARAAFKHLAQIEAEMRALEPLIAATDDPKWEQHMARYGELQTRYEHSGGYEIEHRIERTLHGLSFRPEQYEQPLEQFSGGQRTRAALAIALLSDPDVLLLDEPTNHLDMAALEWLEEFLGTWDGTLIAVSHDRYFLDRVANRTWDLSQRGLDSYPGAYSAFQELKAAKLERQRLEYEAQQEWIEKTQEFVRRFKAGQRSKEARGRQKLLDRVVHGYQGAHGEWIESRVDRPQDQQQIKLNLDAGARTGEIVLELKGLKVGYRTDDGQRVLIDAGEIDLRRGERVALLGPNGSGKTTFFRTLLTELQPLGGMFTWGANVAPGYYAQGHELLNPDATALEEVIRVNPLMGETRARSLLGRLLFTGDDVFKYVRELSGGERSRVALAQLMLRGGNLLLLDEPTNHLDLPSREALEGVLDEYGGALLFISHDRYFIDALADKLWVVEDGRIVEYLGGYSDYAALQEARKAAEQAQKEAQKAVARGGGASQETTQLREQRRQLKNTERQIEQLEAKLAQVRDELEQASAAMDGQRVGELGATYTDIEAQLQDCYTQWAELAQQLEV